MDTPRDMENISNFYDTGYSEIIPLSAVNRINVNMLLDRAVELLPVKKTAIKEPDLKIAIIGRPNSGKSTLLNSFLGYQRAVVSDIPGTTRDSIDEEFMFHGKNIMIIDTAGLRKKSRIDSDIEYYSTRRTVDAINRCDTVIHLIDAAEGLTETDKKISDEIIKASKPAVIAINKWDAVEDKDHKSFDNFKDEMLYRFYKTADYPVISISGKEKLRINKLLTTAIELKDMASMRIETPRLNRIFTDMQNSRRVPELGSLMKIYYAAQTGTNPPAFKIFVNNPEHFRRDAVRHIEKLLTAELGIKGVPIKIVLEGKKERSGGDKKRKRVR
jgi:GTP-binding protein